MATKDISDVTVLRAQITFILGRYPGMGAEDILRVHTKQPAKVCRRAIERAVRHGLLDYGVSIRTAWFTDKGKKLLEDSLPSTKHPHCLNV